MKIRGTIALTLCFLMGSVNATVFTFDDIPGGSIQNNLGLINNYNGFDFSAPLNWIDVVDSSYNYGAVSPDFAMLNNGSGTGFITQENGYDFIFEGLFAKKWDTAPNSGGPDSLFGSISGYNNGLLVWTTSTSLNGSYKLYGPQTEVIDELRLDLGESFLVDDLQLQTVPVPATLWLFGFGLIGLAKMRKKAIN